MHAGSTSAAVRVLHATREAIRLKDDGAYGRLSTHGLDVLSLLVAVTPLSFAISGHVKVLPLALLMLTGLGLLACRAETRHSFRRARMVVAVCALALLYAALNVFGHRLGWAAFDRPSHILLYMMIAAVFSLPLRMRMIWLGFSLTAVLLGSVCIVQHLVLGAPRAYGLNGGDWAAIEFAMFLLVLALMSLLQLLYSQGGRLEKVVHGGGLVFGMYGALLTQSRGPLLAFVPVFLLVLVNYARDTGHWRRSLLLIAAVVCGGVLAGISLHGEVLARFARVGTEVVRYDQSSDELGSVGERLEMWHIAGHAALDHPLTGVGLDRFGPYVREQVAQGHASPEIAKYDHPHNEYLEWAATGGVPGLLVLLSLFGFPLAYFIRHARRGDQAMRVVATAGVAVIVMYALCALTDNVFYRAMPQSLYFFLVLGLAVLIASRNLSPREAPGV